MTTAPAAAQGSNPRTRRELFSEIALPATAYTLPAEIDRFCAALEEVLAKGFPA